MIHIVLRNGKVLRYNTCESCSVDGGAVALHTRDSKFLIARIPLDIVERAEFEKPCAVLRETRDVRKRRRY